MFFRAFKWICYFALFLVAGAFLALGLLEGSCSSLSTAGISCASEDAQVLAELAFGLILLTVFTGVPALFAFLGAVFLVHEIWKKIGPARPEGEDATRPALIRHYAKSALYIFGLLILVGIVAVIFFAEST